MPNTIATYCIAVLALYYTHHLYASIQQLQSIEIFGSTSVCVEGVQTLSCHSCGTYINGSLLPLCVMEETYNVNDTNETVIHLNGMSRISCILLTCAIYLLLTE